MVLDRDEAMPVLANRPIQSVTYTVGRRPDCASACQRRCGASDYRQVSRSERQTAEQTDSGNILIVATVMLIDKPSQHVPPGFAEGHILQSLTLMQNGKSLKSDVATQNKNNSFKTLLQDWSWFIDFSGSILCSCKPIDFCCCEKKF